MHNVAHLDQGEWLEISRDIDGTDQGIRLKIRWMPLLEATEFQNEDASLIESLEKLAALILEWNLEKDGEPIPCTEESKKRYIEYLITLPIEEDGKSITLGRKIIRFACNSANFTKNSQPTSLGTKIGINS